MPGTGIDDYIAMELPGADEGLPGPKTFFHTDRQGSVIAMADTAGNLAEGPYTYDTYGNCFVGASTTSCSTLPTTVEPFRYTGQRFDAETGLYYYRARYYHPAIGRFAETDPAGYKPDVNWYTAFGNDPTDRTDPSGLAPDYDLGNGPNPFKTPEDRKAAAIIVGGGVVVTAAVAACVGGGCEAAGLAVATRAPQLTMGVVAVANALTEDAPAAGGVKAGAAIERSVLSDAQKGNLGRFESKLPANAGQTTITAGKDGSVTMSATSAGRVPGSSATYTKTMDATGRTTGYVKTTNAPSGEVVHVKDKLNR